MLRIMDVKDYNLDMKNDHLDVKDHHVDCFVGYNQTVSIAAKYPG